MTTAATATAAAPWIEIFRVGTQTDMHGRQMRFTDAHLEELASSYDPAVHEAPVVVGHPKHNLPAYGWIAGLKVEDGKLLAQERQVEPEFQEMREAGRFKKRSASFYLPESPGNPTPGKMHLRHVGWLGAQPPAVKGLKDAEFADDGEGVIEFGDAVPKWVMGTMANTLARIRDWFIERDGVEAADRIVSQYDINAIREAGLYTDGANSLPGFTEAGSDTDDATQPPAAGAPAAAVGGAATPTPEEEQAMTQKAEELAARERELAERETALNTRAQAAQTRETEFAERTRVEKDAADQAVAVEFAEGLVREGRLLPKDKDGVVALVRAAQSIEVPLAFGEGDAATEKPAIDLVREVFGALPQQFDFSEKSGEGDVLNPSDSNAVAKAAADFVEAERKAGRTVSVTEAVNRVTKGAR